MKDERLKIKDFAALVGLSRRTLQYYDEIGLLLPEKVDEQGHRYYGQKNFATAFIINALKDVGLSLKEIKAYLSSHEFSMEKFVQEEKARLTAEISELQRRVLLLDNLSHYQGADFLETPTFISLLSQGVYDPEQMKRLSTDLQIEETVDLAEANQFMLDLDYCRQHCLPVEDPLVKKCMLYWQKMLAFLGEHQGFMTKVAEEKYQHSTTSYGMTSENYQYLQKILASNQK